MKKNIIIAAIIGVFIVGGLYGAKKYTPLRTAYVNPSETAAPVSTITVVLNTGEEISTVSGIRAENAFAALTTMAKQKNFELKTKQYDFGVFVEEIGTFVNTKEKSWIYFVNGKAGTVAADKQFVLDGDIVEWRYTKPSME
jgi:hypothetical protein